MDGDMASQIADCRYVLSEQISLSGLHAGFQPARLRMRPHEVAKRLPLAGPPRQRTHD